MSNVAVLGAGAWGGALAQVLASNGNTVKLWTRDEKEVQFMKEKNQIPILMKKGIPHNLEESIIKTSDLSFAIQDAEFVVFVVPSFALRGVAEQVRAVLDHKVICVSATKGLESESHFRMTEILEHTLNPEQCEAVVALTGPSHAEEVIQKKITAVVASSTNIEAAGKVQKIFSNNTFFRVYVNDDPIGAELGGALKNILAVISGIHSELDLGDNARAALITRGLYEITKIGVAAGGSERTFSGLTGIGDLIVTTTSPHSRNFQAGKLLAQGLTVAEVEAKTGATIEGFHAVKAAREIIDEKNIYAPLILMLESVLKGDNTPEEMLKQIFDREMKGEFSEE